MSFLKFTKPINIESEKEKFFASDNYNPNFTYKIDREMIHDYCQKRPIYKEYLLSFVNNDPQAMTEACKKAFQVTFAQSLLDEAEKIVDRFSIPYYVKHHQDQFKAETFHQLFTATSKKLQLGFGIRVTPDANFTARPAYVQKVLNVTSVLPPLTPVNGLVKHEMTHIIRYINGQYNRVAKPVDYLPTEEGLAAYCQTYLSIERPFSEFLYASRFLGAYYATKEKFRNVYNFVLSVGFDKETAWKFASRQKFGLRNTEQPGASIKSAIYFEHMNTIKKLEKDEYIKLFVGKITASQIPDIERYEGMVSRSNLERFLFSKNLKNFL